jgi:hypothetical protein
MLANRRAHRVSDSSANYCGANQRTDDTNKNSYEVANQIAHHALRRPIQDWKCIYNCSKLEGQCRSWQHNSYRAGIGLVGIHLPAFGCGGVPCEIGEGSE